MCNGPYNFYFFLNNNSASELLSMLTQRLGLNRWLAPLIPIVEEPAPAAPILQIAQIPAAQLVPAQVPQRNLVIPQGQQQIERLIEAIRIYTEAVFLMINRQVKSSNFVPSI